MKNKSVLMLSAEEWIIRADRKASDLQKTGEDFMSSNQIIVLVCAIYFLTMVATGIFAARRNKKASDFLVAGGSQHSDDGRHPGGGSDPEWESCFSEPQTDIMTAFGRVSIMRSDARRSHRSGSCHLAEAESAGGLCASGFLRAEVR